VLRTSVVVADDEMRLAVSLLADDSDVDSMLRFCRQCDFTSEATLIVTERMPKE
jgi:hypothetical protein